MKSKRIPENRQYELIMECRSSGMSDAQWCIQHGIRPGTFYSWVHKLRTKACYDIPEPACRQDYIPDTKQEVVKLEITPDSADAAIHDSPALSECISPSIEVVLGTTTIRMNNDADPVLLGHIIRVLGGSLC